MRRSTLLLTITIVLGWLLDFLFWKQPPGINFALYVVLCLVGGWIFLARDAIRPALRAAVLVPPILVLAAATFIRAEPLTLALSLLMTLVLMALLAVSFVAGRWPEYNLWDFVVGYLRLGWSMVAKPAVYRASLRKERDEAGARRAGVIWPIVRGLLIALPVVVVFAALLSSADLVFGRELRAFVELLSLQRLPEFLFRLAYIAAAAYALAGVFLHAADRRPDDPLPSDGRQFISPFLGFTESAIVLGGVIILFAAFVAIQVQYFFGGETNIGLEGFTYSEYARRGFGELLAVAFFSLVLILVLGAVTRRSASWEKRWYSAGAVAVVALVGVMLVSAYQRLNLYEQAYGFSRLRAYTHVLLVWIGILLVTVAALELFRLDRHFFAAALVAAVGFVISLAVLNVDSFIVRRNIARAAQGASLDVAYLASLSTDSVPALAEILQAPSYPEETRQAVGAVLACRDWLRPITVGPDWRSFDVSRSRAARLLSALRPELADYRVSDTAFPPTVATPGGASYSCQDP
jgi:hypothetical protein